MTSILIYSPDAGSRPGHSYIYAARICDRLHSADDDVRLVTSRGFIARYQKLVGEPPAFRVVEEAEADFSGTLVRSSLLGAPRYLLGRVINSRRSLLLLESTLRVEHVDVMHWLDNPETLSTAWFERRNRDLFRKGSPVRWWINVHPGDLGLSFSWRNPLRSLYKGISRRILKRLISGGSVSGVFVHGDWIKERLVKSLGLDAGSGRVIVTPYGTDHAVEKSSADQLEARKQLGIPDNAWVVLAFGMVRRDKGLDDILRAISDVPEVMLLIVGMPTDLSESELSGWVDDHGLGDRVKMHLEYVPEEDIPVIFAAADVCVMAHKKSFTGQSGPLHLACSYLTPVIASDVGEIGLFVKRYGIGRLFPPGDYLALSRRLLEFQTMDPGDLEVYLDNERDVTRIESWDSMVACYRNAYGLQQGCN